MRISQKGIDLIKSFESCRLTSYKCSANRDTIGWGSTKNVKPGMKITQAEADSRLKADLAEAEAGVNKLLTRKVTQNQFDSLVSFAFNCGLDIDADAIAEGLGDSTLLKKLNSGDIEGAAAEFPKWCKSKGKELTGLKRRREAEKKLFLTK